MKKILILSVSLVLLITVCIPGTLANPTDTQSAVLEENILFEQLMASETLEEFWTLLENYTDEDLENLLDESELMQLSEKLDSLLPPPAPKVIVGESDDKKSFTDPMEDSKIISPTVNFSNVAPLGLPVIG